MANPTADSGYVQDTLGGMGALDWKDARTISVPLHLEAGRPLEERPLRRRWLQVDGWRGTSGRAWPSCRGSDRTFAVQCNL